MKKLLHERLRRIDNQEYTSVVLENGHAITFWDNEAQYLADEIERNYIPRLRFENDAPLQWGEMVDGYDKPIDGIKLFDDGSGRVGNHRDDDLYWAPFSILKNSSLNRPPHKEPDTLNKLLNDLQFAREYTYENDESVRRTLHEFGNRLSALIERDQ